MFVCLLFFFFYLPQLCLSRLAHLIPVFAILSCLVKFYYHVCKNMLLAFNVSILLFLLCDRMWDCSTYTS